MLVIREAENEASRGTEGARRATGVARGAAGRTGDGPDPEVAEKATRRRFSGEYKRRIVSEADRCRNVGEVGALLRREGLYSSSLSTWRRQGAAGALAGTGSVKRGPKAPPKDVRDTRIAELERETRRLQRKLTQAENDHWHPKKSCHAAGDPSAERGRRRARLMEAAETFSVDVGTAASCRAFGVARSSLYRRRQPPPTVVRIPRASHRALSDVERQEVLDLLHSQRFVDQAPAQVAAALLDEERYLCSARTMYRILDANEEVRERRNQRRHPAYPRPELLATGPNQVWSWDITKLKGPRKWTYFYLYVILDIFSRQVVGWMVADCESASLAKTLIRASCDKQRIDRDQLILHADRGSSMKSKAVALLLSDLGITKSHSRPYVSDDNPFSEAQFKTLKYRPGFPERFGSIQDAKSFCRTFFNWYNNAHYHSGLNWLTPAMVHSGQTGPVLARRQHALDRARRQHPERFVNAPRKVAGPPDKVWINPPDNSQAIA